MAKPCQVLLIDNYDSFAFNLVDELRKLGAVVDVWRNDIAAEHALELAQAYVGTRLILLSPGPGRPEDAGCCEKLIALAAGQIPMFGVCLGLQAMVQAYGGRVGSAGDVVHGKSDWVTHDGSAFCRAWTHRCKWGAITRWWLRRCRKVLLHGEVGSIGDGGASRNGARRWRAISPRVDSDAARGSAAQAGTAMGGATPHTPERWEPALVLSFEGSVHHGRAIEIS